MRKVRRGCPAAQTSLRSLRTLDCVPGMTIEAAGLIGQVLFLDR
jgi:hypothetical protein